VFQTVIGHNIHHAIKIFRDANEIDTPVTNSKLFGNHSRGNFTSGTYILGARGSVVG
jgi:hypothetical protein